MHVSKDMLTMRYGIKTSLGILVVSCHLWLLACSDDGPSQLLKLDKPLSNSPTAASQRALKKEREAQKTQKSNGGKSKQ